MLGKSIDPFMKQQEVEQLVGTARSNKAKLKFLSHD